MEEDAYRFLQFLDNWKMINEHNSGDASFTLGMNQFGDLSLDECEWRIVCDSSQESRTMWFVLGILNHRFIGIP